MSKEILLSLTINQLAGLQTNLTIGIYNSSKQFVFLLKPSQNKMNKTNAARLLDSKNIYYELLSYDVDESDLSAHAVASKLGQDVDQVFKTLVLRGDKTGIFICIIPGSRELDLKKAARASGNKNAAMVQMKEILELTGYIRGGCSPIGMKKKYHSYIDENCILYDHIFVSAGIRGLQLKLAPDDLIRETGSEICELTES
jgi:Cys-tRNA(Pro)/Cys-tRNA(Cys) deacylase